jgi:hypothetical protein
VTTPPGKPPLDAQDPDKRWDGSGGDSSAGTNAVGSASAGPDSAGPESVDPPTPRNDPRRDDAGRKRSDPNAGVSGEGSDGPQIYGIAVPYGGDDRTEEIDPVAIDMPFAPDQRGKTPKAPKVTPTPPKAASAARDYELQMPVAQLTLSDLFDSVPSSTSLAPPDPAAFSSSRPPAPAKQPAPVASVAHLQNAVVAMPSIDVGAARPAAPQPRVEAPPARTEIARHDAQQFRADVSVGRDRPSAPRNEFGAPRNESGAPRNEPSAPRNETSASRNEPSAPRNETSAPRNEPSAPRNEPSAPRNEPSVVREEPAVVARKEPSAPHEPSSADNEQTAPLPIEPSLARNEPSVPRDELVSSSEPEPTPIRVDAPAQRPASTFPRPEPRSLGRDSQPPAETPVPEAPSEPRRRSVPTLESVGNAAAKELGSAPGAGSSPKAARSNPGASQLAGAEGLLEPIARFPSEVPTSRPPDVMLSPSSSPSGRPAPWIQTQNPRELRQPMATVASPAALHGRGQSQLPSIMLGADVEAEPDSNARRAMRAARQTVRLELPPGFNRPGGPGGVPSAPPSYAPAGVGQVIQPALPWLGNPRTRRLLGAAAALLFLFVLLMISLRPRTGSLVVTALGPGNRAVDDVTIFIDGKPLCDISPCRIKGLTPGEHTLRASAQNLASQAEETVAISAGDEATYNIDLLAVAPEVRAGGMRVPAGETPLTLFVDGKRVGRLPQEVSGLSGGKHWIKLDPEDGGDTIEKSVNVLPGETIEVEPKAAKRDKALVTIRLSPGSEGAAVTFDDAFLLDFPAELELEPSSVHTLSATKAGYEDLNLEVRVTEGETEKLIDVALSPLDGRPAADGNASKKPRPAKAARKPAAKPATTAPTQLADSTQGLLNISSVPPSQIILNGRPLGSTPKTGISVPGDSLQTIVFVHPKMGRRRAQKFVPAGKERTVSIRF